MDPKFDPLIVTGVPTLPDVGDRVVILGVGTTVKLTPLLLVKFTFTTTLPVVAPLGTGTVILVLLQFEVGDTVPTDVPLKVTVLVPCVDPKFVPVIVTEAPTAPDMGNKLLMVGLDDPPPVLAAPTL